MSRLRPYPDLWYLVLFAVGALVMRGAGCAYNDFVDREYDARVQRTRSRPIPSGQVTPSQALLYAATLALVGFLVLIQLNTFTVWLAIASLALIAVYPFTKRFTYWPQLVLGLVFNWGALVGWAAVRARCRSRRSRSMPAPCSGPSATTPSTRTRTRRTTSCSASSRPR